MFFPSSGPSKSRSYLAPTGSTDLDHKLNITIASSLFIARPIADIWNYVSDLTNDALWRKGVESRWTSDEPHGLGSTGASIVEREGEIRWKWSELEDRRSMGWDYLNGRFAGGHGGYRMAPEAGGTRMTMHMEIQGGFIFGILIKFIAKRRMSGDLKKLKARLEHQSEFA